MKSLCCCLLLVVAVLSALTFQNSAQSNSQQSGPLVRARVPLQIYEQAPLPPLSGRIDHFTADAKRRRVIFSALGNHSVELFEVFTATIIHSIKEGLDEPQAVLFIDELDKLWVTNAGNGKVMIYTGANYKLEKTIDVGADPDNLRYHAPTKTVIVGYGEGNVAGFATFNAVTGERLGNALLIHPHPAPFH